MIYFAFLSYHIVLLLSSKQNPRSAKKSLAKLLLVQIDSPEDVGLHLPRTVIHMENNMDLIPANKRLADAAARLQVMQLSQYNAGGIGRDILRNDDGQAAGHGPRTI